MTGKLPVLLRQAIEPFIRKIPRLEERELRPTVESFLSRRQDFLAAVKAEGSPLYVFDTDALRERARRFRGAFDAVLADIRIYYALKSNCHPHIAATLVHEGYGLDVSSGLELNAALDGGAGDIVFSGPGKRIEELTLAVNNADRVTLLLDSIGELRRLEETAARVGTVVHAGVRLTTEETGLWRKFGIPLEAVPEFFEEAAGCGHVNLCGLQFHISWNLDPEAQAAFIARLGKILSGLDRKYRDNIRFLDIGGGFWPEQGEWLQAAAIPRGILQTALEDKEIRGLEHYRQEACSINTFAKRIAEALEQHIPADMKYTVCLEPGRWLCNDAMHILLTVVDKKSPEVVITDGGTNAVGWERFETDFFPVINLTRPGLDERACLVAGSLCTPHDLWGYGYFGEGIEEGDVLLVPNQGAYTYSLRQEFIKPLPGFAELSASGSDRTRYSYPLIAEAGSKKIKLK